MNEPQKSIETRISELEEAVNNLVSAMATNMQTFSESHTVFVKEISTLKERVAGLEKR